jgi:hypothetical protein
VDVEALIARAESGEEGIWTAVERMAVEGTLEDVADALWCVVTEVERPLWVRRDVMHSVAHREVVDDHTLGRDLGAVLCSEDEEDGLRGDAADLIGGLALRACLGVVEAVLEDGEQGAEVVFWSLYAASQIGGEGTQALVARYVEDERVVVLGAIEATVAEEAEWALATLRGEQIDPAWQARFDRGGEDG